MAKSYIIDNREINGETQIKKWVQTGIDKDAVEFAQCFGTDLAKMREALTTAQIRNVFGEVRRIQMLNKKAYKDKEQYNEAPILLLRPKLAYAAKRSNKRAVKELADVLSAGINAVVAEGDVVEKLDRFEKFADFFEAVLAYHKAAGGKE